MRAIITGMTGFVGKHLGQLLLEQGYDLVAIVRKGSPSNTQLPEDIKQIATDLADPEQLYNDLMDIDIDLNGAELYHCAAIISASQAWRSAYQTVNVEASAKLAEFALERGISKFIFLSSMGAGGAQGGLVNPMDESTEPKPRSIYSRSKLEAEETLREILGEKIPLVIFRPPNIYGEDMSMKSGSALIFKSLRSFMFPIIGNGHNHVNMVYIKNLVQGIYVCSQNVDEGVELFYISDDHPYLMSHFIKMVKEEWGSNTRLLRIPKIVVYPFAMLMDWVSNLIGKNIGFNTEIVIGMATNDFVFSIDKAKEFGYTPPFDLKEAVHNTCQWIEEQSQLE